MEEDNDGRFVEILSEYDAIDTDEYVDYDDNLYETPDITDDTVNEFVLDNASRIVQENMVTMGKIRKSIMSANNVDEITALTNLTRVTNATLDTLTKISLQNKKQRAPKVPVAKLPTPVPATQPLQITGDNTQVVISTREDIFSEVSDPNEPLDLSD